MKRLDDPWFAAEFVCETNEKGFRRCDDLVGADGLFLWCPCAYGQDGKAHGLLVHFRNPIGCAPATSGGSVNKEGKPVRWRIVSGTGLHDLTLEPSIAVGNPECWHGWIREGIVTP